ncbi:MarR family winged helix-turn-helix transcriptional regulator [Streptomyces sp. NPDC018833]|uniref:MarR family winged helix-turn-helix transcriptional regulator n=1 Tax=Streptomyces sp. NPDC018833 TaxID=3365053 RepID=UPI0037BC9717
MTRSAPDDPGPELLGTRLRLLLGRLEADVAAVHADLGLAGMRPRYVPFLRTLAADGPSSIQDLATTVGVTHSAASQTVAQLAREGLVRVGPGQDARRRLTSLTPAARELLPALETEWEATSAAAAAFEAELSHPLSELITEALEALDRRPMRERIAAALPHPIRGRD